MPSIFALPPISNVAASNHSDDETNAANDVENDSDDDVLMQMPSEYHNMALLQNMPICDISAYLTILNPTGSGSASISTATNDAAYGSEPDEPETYQTPLAQSNYVKILKKYNIKHIEPTKQQRPQRQQQKIQQKQRKKKKKKRTKRQSAAEKK